MAIRIEHVGDVAGRVSDDRNSASERCASAKPFVTTRPNGHLYTHATTYRLRSSFRIISSRPRDVIRA
jgi:hypothetical protein